MVRSRVEGMIPFTRQALWRKVEECLLLDNSFSLSASPGSLPSSQPSSSPDPSPTPDEMQGTLPLPPSAPTPQLINTPFPVAVLEVLDYIASIAPAVSEILDIQAVMMQNVRLVEAIMVIGAWRKTRTVQEDNTDKNNK